MNNLEKLRIVKSAVEKKKGEYLIIGHDKMFLFRNLHWWMKHMKKYIPLFFQEKHSLYGHSDELMEDQAVTIGLLDGKINEPCNYAEEFPFCFLRVDNKLLANALDKIPKQLKQVVIEDKLYNKIRAFLIELPQYVDALLAYAVDKKDFTASCMLYYILVENGISHSFLVFIRRVELAMKKDSVFEDFVNAINGKGEMTPVNITPDFLRKIAFRTDEKEVILSQLLIRRFHREHEEEYDNFVRQILSSETDDFSFASEINESFDSFSFSASDIRERVPRLISYVRTISIVYGICSAPAGTFGDDYNLLSKLFPILQSDVMIDYLRNSLKEKEPCLMHALYWLIFDDGCLVLGKKIIKDLMPRSKSNEEKEKALLCLKALIEISYGNFYDKPSWQKLANASPNPQVCNKVERYLQDVGRRRKQNAQYMLLEELMEEGVNAMALIRDIRPYLFKKIGNSKSKVLACLFLALREIKCIKDCPHYRVFHMALVEFFCSISIEGWDMPERIVKARMKEKKEEELGRNKGKKEKKTSLIISAQMMEEMTKKFNVSKNEPRLPQLPITDSQIDIFK